MKGMSFKNYLYVTFSRGTLPSSAKNLKSVLLPFLPWILFFVPVAITCHSHYMLTFILSTPMLFVLIYISARDSAVPSVYRLYPLTPKMKAVYDFFGTLLFSLLFTLLIFLLFTIYQLAICLLLFIVLSVPDFTVSNGLIETLFPFFTFHVTAQGAIFLVAYILMGFGFSTFITDCKKFKSRIIFSAIFLAVHAAAVFALFFTLGGYSGGEDADFLTYIEHMPLNWLFSVLYTLAAVALSAVGAILKINK